MEITRGKVDTTFLVVLEMMMFHSQALVDPT
jgi:hypothetical protein